MKILIIGASGLVGSNFKSYLETNKDISVIGTWLNFRVPGAYYFNTLDLSNPDNIDIKSFKPDVIVHTGALTHVDYCENHPEESYLHTVTSVENVIKLCKEFNSALLYISTDYVYDGNDGPYTEKAKVNPLSVYGRHKLEAEKLIISQIGKHLIVRVTNVYGHEVRRKNFVLRMIDQCKKNEELDLELPLDQYATPINALDIAKAATLLLLAQQYGIYNLGSTDYFSRVQLAVKIKSYYQTDKVNIIPVTTKELGQSAPRPLLGGLLCTKFLQLYPLFEFQNIDDFLLRESAL